MKFSIIVPTHNRKTLLSCCLVSLLSLNYPKQNYEIIVVDDGSTDDTQLFVDSLKNKYHNLYYFKINHSGQGAARNLGLKKANGKYIAFTDDDCVVEKNWLKKIEKTFNKTKADAVGGSIINPTERYIAISQYILNFSSHFPKGSDRYVKDIPTANVAYKKSSIKNLYFPEYLEGAVYEDSLFNIELIKKNKKILFCPNIEVKHFTWKEDYGLRKFFKIQKKSAVGFVLGGYRVHGKVGKILYNFRFLNLFCPRLLMVFLRCSRYRYIPRFILCFPLIFLGELYRGIIIYSIANQKLIRV